MVCQIEIDNLIPQTFHNSDEEYDTTFSTMSSQEADAIKNGTHLNDKTSKRSDGASVFQTSLNVGKMCMGTGTLALPFAAEKGGLFFNAIGLGLIGLWNYYSANCLLRCLELLPEIDKVEVNEVKSVDGVEHQIVYGTMDSNHANNKEQGSVPPPPDGTTTYGAVAWYASGPKGLMVLDLLMLSLFFGLLIAYEVAMQSFINDTPLTTGSKSFDLLIPSAIIAIISCAPDMSFLSKFSGMGLLAVGLSFVVISWQGFQENGFSGFRSTLKLNRWPASLSAASSWFGVVVFGYGVVPFVFSFRNSMANPQQVGLCLQIGLSLVYIGYIVMSNGIWVLFSPDGHVFDGDVLQAMPDTWISSVVRLLMTFAVAVTAPLIVVPFGELVEGKIGTDKTQQSSLLKRIVVRVSFCIVCTLFAEFLGSGFVHIVSFIGCFCVSIAGFVLPPLFIIQLSNQNKSACKREFGVDSVLLCDAAVLLLGIIATIITSTLTFRELMMKTKLENAKR
eukprot:CAMPEP_0172534506 /NCGR_PEP_ID=MMETSP1067-20121228/6845_1 /TAXON_ID=265564 ORGANISM="Thalassiosira punctigera, Strain Tpunct2005C2" /NCGR_SAMPLE_ID=MMETSP1067 /ASSEMBLY_ACC=CAM_ASM_000444 /LENGTH=503 /DNA_ID=CAMNT_0013319307 /DNA_START=277 /DNA_END=1788 /DNA_ORIENTATION=+